MGISPFKKRFDLLLEKAELKENDFEGNEYTEYGNVMEEKIRDYINEKEKDKFVEGKTIVNDIRCHTDGENKTTILEIKTTSQIHEEVNDYKIYLVQLLFYMQTTKRKKGKLAVYKRPEDFNTEFDSKNLSIYDINLKDYTNTLEDINQAVECFKNDLKKVKENPFITEEELLPTDIIKASRELEIIEDKIREFKLLEEQEKEIKNKLKEAMDNHNIKTWKTTSGITITSVANGIDKIETKETIDLSKLKEEQEDIYYKYVKIEEVTKKGKAGYLKITMPKEDK